MTTESTAAARLRSNPPKIYAYKFLSEFFLVVPVLIPYYIYHGLNATQIFTIQAAYHVAVLVLEIPSGYLADVVGRKRTLVLGVLFFPASMALYAFTGSFWTFVLAEATMAVANSMRSGCDSALMYDTLIQLDREGEYRQFEGRSFLFTRLGTALASVVGGVLAVRSLHLPFYVNVATYCLIPPIALTLVEPARKKREGHSPLLDILHISARCFKHRRLRWLMLMAALLQAMGVTGVWSYFLYFRQLHLRLALYGLLFAVFQLASALGSASAHAVSRRIGEKASLVSLLGVGLVYIALGAVSSPALIALIVPSALLWGFGWPVFMDAFNRLTVSEIRATVLSVASMCASIVFVIMSPLFGKLVDAAGLSVSFIVLGAANLLFGGFFLIMIFRTQGETSLVK